MDKVCYPYSVRSQGAICFNHLFRLQLPVHSDHLNLNNELRSLELFPCHPALHVQISESQISPFRAPANRFPGSDCPSNL